MLFVSAPIGSRLRIPDEDGSANGNAEGFRQAGWLVRREMCGTITFSCKWTCSYEDYLQPPRKVRTTLKRKSGRFGPKSLPLRRNGMGRITRPYTRRAEAARTPEFQHLRESRRRGRLPPGDRAGCPIRMTGNRGADVDSRGRKLRSSTSLPIGRPRVLPGVGCAAMIAHALDRDRVSLQTAPATTSSVTDGQQRPRSLDMPSPLSLETGRFWRSGRYAACRWHQPGVEAPGNRRIDRPQILWYEGPCQTTPTCLHRIRREPAWPGRSLDEQRPYLGTCPSLIPWPWPLLTELEDRLDIVIDRRRDRVAELETHGGLLPLPSEAAGDTPRPENEG